MMIDQWETDIISVFEQITGIKDCPIRSPDDQVACTNAAFTLMNSYAWSGEFEGAKLKTACHEKSGNHLAWIEIPPKYDLDSDPEEPIHEGRILMPFHSKEDLPLLRGNDEKCFSYPISHEKTQSIIEHLRESSNYYKKLTEQDSDQQMRNIESLIDIDYEFMRLPNFSDLIQQTNFSRCNRFGLNTIFGHHYANEVANRSFIVAKNWLGPVGLACLFDNAQKGTLEYSSDRYTLASISVTPSYRGQGIAKQLIRECINQCLKEERILTRTHPSEMAQKGPFESFTQLAKTEYPGFPFIKRDLRDYVHALKTETQLNDLTFRDKCQVVCSFADRLEQILDVNHRFSRKESEQIDELVEATRDEINTIRATYIKPDSKTFYNLNHSPST